MSIILIQNSIPSLFRTFAFRRQDGYRKEVLKNIKLSIFMTTFSLKLYYLLLFKQIAYIMKRYWYHISLHENLVNHVKGCFQVQMDLHHPLSPTLGFFFFILQFKSYRGKMNKGLHKVILSDPSDYIFKEKCVSLKPRLEVKRTDEKIKVL